MAHQETAQLQHRVPAEASLGSDRLHLKNSWSHLWLLLTQVYWLACAFTFLFLFCHLALLFVVFPFTSDAGKEDCCSLVLAAEI